ncbi:MAG: alpha-glucan family phosphorylase [Planctomycetota bacterium]|jgi:starch phosphorylase
MIAYFSMEIGLEPGMPTFSGGLGMLAGDSIRSASDLKLPMVAVSLLHRKGYFYQRLDESGRQNEEPVAWSIDDFVTELEPRVTVSIAGRTVHVRGWRRDVVGVTGSAVPVLLLDTDLPENDAADRTLTDSLYGGDDRYRLSQEIVLGIGGVRLLRALGYDEVRRFHMNEGHAALLAVELMREHLERTRRKRINEEAVKAVQAQCVFTTHTPVPAGHDKFGLDLARELLGEHRWLRPDSPLVHDGMLNLTYAALNLSQYVNGVAKRHGEISREMFAGYTVDSITNGVHLATWTSPPMQTLLDRHIPGWREDNASVRSSLGIPADEIWRAHGEAKSDLIRFVNRRTNAGLDEEVLTICFARRMTAYKRPTLLFSDPERLQAMARAAGPLQVIFAGKAHPRDEQGKGLIHEIHQVMQALDSSVKVAYMRNYDMDVARRLVGGCDLWLNTPRPPMEASGTSGMKAAINGIPSLSVLDGWWIEGCIEGVTGWAVESSENDDGGSEAESESLYDKLQTKIMPMFYRDRAAFIGVMKHAIALNGSFFNTERR